MPEGWIKESQEDNEEWFDDGVESAGESTNNNDED
jgi:hypothetical protein